LSGEEVFSKKKCVIFNHKEILHAWILGFFKAIVSWERNEWLTHEFFKILSALFVDEMGDLVGCILNENTTTSATIREVLKVTIKNLLARLKGKGFYSAKERTRRNPLPIYHIIPLKWVNGP
jgi:hypothetical protein